MAEYVKLDAIMEYCQNQKDKTISCNDIARFNTADVIERSEYEYLKKENRELAIKYDNAMNMVINEQENVTRLRSKIDEAIEEMDSIDLNEYADNTYQLVNKCIEILKEI